MDDGAGGHALHDSGDRLALRVANAGDGAATAFAHHDNAAAFAGLVLSEATVNAALLVVRGLNVPAEIRAINFNGAGQGDVGRFRRHALAQLVGQDVSGAVLAIEVAGKLKSANAFRTVCEDGDSAENIPDFHFAAGEDRAGSGRELGLAILALEDAARGVGVDRQRSALGAARLAAVVRVPDRHEHLEGFLIGQAHDLSQAQGPGFGRQEEVLGHIVHDFDISITNMI